MLDTMTRHDLSLDVADLPPDEAVTQLIDHAANLEASDLFFAAHEQYVGVSVRHLGVFRLISRLSPDLGRRCMSLIKVNANIDIAEHRHPLDGRWLRECPGVGTVDLRINTLPTLHGEDINVRLLVRHSRLLQLDNLGLAHRDHNLLVDLLDSPSGLILVTGPTGSGKTTMLYAALNYLDNGERKINTIEDPIEYSLEGIRQSQVTPRLDFPDVLRAVLRQAPDVIMVGEIRDPVTAETAVRAANSGHLVLATLHAPVAAAAVQSMHSLGVNPHFLGACLRGVIAMRLLRTLCPECKKEIDFSPFPNMFEDIQPHLRPGEGQTLFAARGCPACHMSGFAGRTGVFEFLHVTEPIRKLIFSRQPTQLINQKATEEGMLDLHRAALLKVAQGETCAEEVLRVIPGQYLGVED